VYHFDGRRFVFASDVKGVLAQLESPRLNEPLLAAYLQMRTYYAEKTLTFFEGIVKLPPAHTLTLNAGGIRTSRYWSPEDAPDFRLAKVADYAEQLAFLFRQAVECRLRSAFPIGAHLSGGMDSSSVSIAASRLLRERGQELALFSWSPPPVGEAPDEEYARIDAVCRQERLSCEYIPVTAASLIATFRRDFTVEPTAMMARESSVQARAEARQLRVMLSGWGGDDAVTCGAVTSPALYLQRGEWAEFRRAIASRARRFGGLGLLRELAFVSLPDPLYAATMGNAYQAHRSPCIRSEFARRYRNEVRNMRGPAFRRMAGVRETICLYLESGQISARAEDWAESGARHGLVYRYPMLDKRLVEFALGVPASPSREADRRRSLFLRAVGGMLPASVDWEKVKAERATFAALEKERIQAHADWARHLPSEKADSPATRYVDPARIQAAIRRGVRSGRVQDLSGVSEAFGCYAMQD
jgi:asparagine synthase (glutamine-hydrolysing)